MPEVPEIAPEISEVEGKKVDGGGCRLSIS